jgi:hypothetical protein
MRNPLRTMAATILVLEAFAVFFGALVLGNLPGTTLRTEVGLGRALLVVGGLALALLLTAGILRWRLGYVVGSLLQVAVLATGYWLPMMVVVGLMFVALWVAALWAGLRIERERAAGPSAEDAGTAGG